MANRASKEASSSRKVYKYLLEEEFSVVIGLIFLGNEREGEEGEEEVSISFASFSRFLPRERRGWMDNGRTSGRRAIDQVAATE